MFRARLVPTLLLICLFTGIAEGQEEPKEAARRTSSIVVTGAPPERAAQFVHEVMPEGWSSAARGVPKWDSELCVSVIGPPIDQGQFIADRISSTALSLGLEVGAPECDTNLLILVTNDPETLLPAVARQHRALFGFTGDSSLDTSGSEVSLAQFIAEGRPVRWRQVVETIGADGMPLDGDSRTNPLKYQLFDNMPLAKGEASRLRSNVRRQFSRVVAVVDTTQTAGLGLGAISDYLAFVTLADVSAEADLSAFPSILNLFNPDAERQPRMTDWDIAFLDSLYSARLNAASGTAQYREIADRMVRERKDD